MIRAVIRSPGKPVITGRDCNSAEDALRWAIGYVNPPPAFPPGTVILCHGHVYAVLPHGDRNVIKPLGGKPA
jgi:hypothetical protein